MPRRPRPTVTPPYDPAAWSSLVNACRQPRGGYRWALLVPGAASLEGLPGAGAGGRWFLLPVGALLLRRDPGRLSMLDLEAESLRLGPFLLRRMRPVGPEAAKRRTRLRAVRVARAALRRTRVAGVVAVPNEGRAVRFGARLVLSVSGAFLRERKRAARGVGLRLSGGGRIPEAGMLMLVAALNRMTEELEAVGEFAWTDVEMLRGWDACTRDVLLSALTRSGWKGKAARLWVAGRLRPWRRSTPSLAVVRAASSGPAQPGGLPG